MRVPTALRAVALSTTLAGLLVLPAPATAAAPKSKPRASVKSAKSTSKSKAKPSASKASTSKAPSATKAAFDPVAAPSTPIPAAPPATAAAGAGAPPQRGPTRIDFDDRLIQGQTNKSGAVYLYDRKELKQRSMIKKRESFREEIVGAVYDSEL
jgi:hypothetical protein